MLRLKELRQIRNLTGQDVADALGLDRSLYVRYENGTRTPPLDKLLLLSEYFGVSLGCIAGVEPIPEGYGEAWTQPVFYSEVIENQRKAEQEGRLAKKPEKPPFSKEQMEFLKNRDDELVEKVVSALREDSSLSKEPEAR